MKASKIKFAVVYLVGMVTIHTAMFWNVRDLVRKGYSDFAIYYGAGSMVRHGLAHQLYDEAAQFKVQQEFSPEVAIRRSALPYNHPAFEAVLFVPFTYVPYAWAFTLWDGVNLAMLVALPFLLLPHLRRLHDYGWHLWVLASLGFFPVFVALLQGQDSILLLFFYVLAFVCLKKDRDALAGVWLALGMFKPQLVVPFVILLLVQGRRKVLYGFLPAAALVTLVSVAVVGREAMAMYPHYVLHLEDTLARGAIVPGNMPNLRGVLYLLLQGGSGVAGVAIGLSIGIFLFAAWQCRDARSEDGFDLQLSLAMVATILVSYHLLSYDLSLLLLPLMLVANQLLRKERWQGWPRMLILAAVAALFFSPGLLLLLRDDRLAWMGWAVLLLMAAIAGQLSSRTFQAGEAA